MAPDTMSPPEPLPALFVLLPVVYSVICAGRGLVVYAVICVILRAPKMTVTHDVHP